MTWIYFEQPFLSPIVFIKEKYRFSASSTPPFVGQKRCKLPHFDLIPFPLGKENRTPYPPSRVRFGGTQYEIRSGFILYTHTLYLYFLPCLSYTLQPASCTLIFPKTYNLLTTTPLTSPALPHSISFKRTSFA